MEDFLGKSKKEIQALMKEDYGVDMHINTARTLGEKIEEWHREGLPIVKAEEVRSPKGNKVCIPINYCASVC